MTCYFSTRLPRNSDAAVIQILLNWFLANIFLFLAFARKWILGLVQRCILCSWEKSILSDDSEKTRHSVNLYLCCVVVFEQGCLLAQKIRSLFCVIIRFIVSHYYHHSSFPQHIPKVTGVGYMKSGSPCNMVSKYLWNVISVPEFMIKHVKSFYGC